jgi:RNA polymerase sigma-70 factor (ECF subfamily)
MGEPRLATSAELPEGPATGSEPGPAEEMPPFSVVYSKYFNFVWSCTRRLGVYSESMDDVVQEVFIVIHSRLKTVERRDALRSWIYGVVRRTVSSHRRALRVREGAVEDPLAYEGLGSFQPSPLDLALQTDEVRLLASLLGEIDEAKREVFVLAELEEMTVPEIAQAIGIPVNTAYSRLRAARLDFEEALARHAAKREAGDRLCRT